MGTMTERYGAYALAGNPAAPADVLLRLLALDDRSITHRLSYHAALTGEVAEAMLTHPERWVRHLLADSFTAAPELRARPLDGPAFDAMAVAISPNPYRIQAPPPDEAYERLLNHEQVNVRYETVNAASTPDPRPGSAGRPRGSLLPAGGLPARMAPARRRRALATPRGPRPRRTHRRLAPGHGPGRGAHRGDRPDAGGRLAPGGGGGARQAGAGPRGTPDGR
ncbi:hypothetical protein ACFXA0_10450 [Streptomyces cyaneofuscatus]|uniref:hypothetical protein n=1 Tax=Streptomyces cyaneofuscatus TaxID=66883 RepID=UPI00367CC2A2